MNCVGSFVFKGVERRQAGEFANEDGELIKYNECFVLTVDEIVRENKTRELKFKFPKENTEFYNDLLDLNLYDTILIKFDVELYKSNVKLVPTNLEPEM